MTKIAISVLAAIALAGPVSVASGDPNHSGSKPSSYTPQHHANRHVYGSPIHPPIMGRAKASHPKHSQKRRSASAASHDAQEAPAHHHQAKTPQ